MRAIQPDAGYYNDVSISHYTSLLTTSLFGGVNLQEWEFWFKVVLHFINNIFPEG